MKLKMPKRIKVFIIALLISLFISGMYAKPIVVNSTLRLPTNWTFDSSKTRIVVKDSANGAEYDAYLVDYKNNSLNYAWLITDANGTPVKDRNLYYALAETAEAASIAKEYPYSWFKEKSYPMNKMMVLIKTYQILSVARDISKELLGLVHSLLSTATKHLVVPVFKKTASVSSRKFVTELAKELKNAGFKEGVKQVMPARIGTIAELVAMNQNIHYLSLCKSGFDDAYSVIKKYQNGGVWNTKDAQEFIDGYYRFWHYMGAMQLFNDLTNNVGTKNYWLTLGGDIAASLAGSPVDVSDIEDAISAVKGYSEIDEAFSAFDASVENAEKGEIAWRQRSYDCLQKENKYFINYAYILFNDLNSNKATSNILFSDDFSNGLSQWRLFGSPEPVIDYNAGNPAPSFNNNGDANYDSGAYSIKEFNPAGTVLEGDIYVASHPDGCWMSGSIGFAKSDTGFTDTGWPGYAVGIMYYYIGDACWASSSDHREHGALDCYLVTDDGSNKGKTFFLVDSYLNAWHHYKIVITPDRYVKFYIDNTLVYAPTYKLGSQFTREPLVLGNRSYYGDSLVDNVRLTRTSSPNTNKTIDTEIHNLTNVLVYFNGPIEIRTGPGSQYKYVGNYIDVGGISANSMWPKKCKKDKSGRTWYLIPPVDFSPGQNSALSEGKAWLTGKNLIVIDYNKLRKFVEKKVNSVNCIVKKGAPVRFGPGKDFESYYTVGQTGKAVIVAESRDPKGRLWYKINWNMPTEMDMTTPQWVLSDYVTIKN